MDVLNCVITDYYISLLIVNICEPHVISVMCETSNCNVEGLYFQGLLVVSTHKTQNWKYAIGSGLRSFLNALVS